MRKLTLTHDINCSEIRFWDVFFDRAFNTTLFRDELQFPAYDIVTFSELDGAIKRVVRAIPKMEMPKAVMKLLGDSFSYEEHGSFNPTSKVWSFKMTPSTLASKLRNEGTVRSEPIDDNRCRRITTIELEAKIFGVGGLIESSSEIEMRNGWNHSAKFMNQWLTDHPES